MTNLSDRILTAAIDEAVQHGVSHISRAGVAARAGVATGSLSHFATPPGKDRATLTDIKRAVCEARPDLHAPELDRYQVDRAARDERILCAALTAALEHGWQRFTRAHVADAAGMSPAGVSNYKCASYEQRDPHAMSTLRDDVMRAAVTRGEAALVGQGLAAGDAVALAAPAELRERALRAVLG